MTRFVPLHEGLDDRRWMGILVVTRRLLLELYRCCGRAYHVLGSLNLRNLLLRTAMKKIRVNSLYELNLLHTPVPLSTTSGRSESMVELKKGLFVMLCSSLSNIKSSVLLE